MLGKGTIVLNNMARDGLSQELTFEQGLNSLKKWSKPVSKETVFQVEEIAIAKTLESQHAWNVCRVAGRPV